MVAPTLVHVLFASTTSGPAVRTAAHRSLSGGVAGLVQELGEHVEPVGPGVPPMHALGCSSTHSAFAKQQARGCGQVLGEQVVPALPGVPEHANGVESTHVPSSRQHAARHEEAVQVVPEPMNCAPLGQSDEHTTTHESRKQQAPGVPTVHVTGAHVPRLQVPLHWTNVVAVHPVPTTHLPIVHGAGVPPLNESPQLRMVVLMPERSSITVSIQSPAAERPANAAFSDTGVPPQPAAR